MGRGRTSLHQFARQGSQSSTAQLLKVSRRAFQSSKMVYDEGAPEFVKAVEVAAPALALWRKLRRFPPRTPFIIKL